MFSSIWKYDFLSRERVWGWWWIDTVRRIWFSCFPFYLNVLFLLSGFNCLFSSLYLVCLVFKFIKMHLALSVCVCRSDWGRPSCWPIVPMTRIQWRPPLTQLSFFLVRGRGIYPKHCLDKSCRVSSGYRPPTKCITVSVHFHSLSLLLYPYIWRSSTF